MQSALEHAESYFLKLKRTLDQVDLNDLPSIYQSLLRVRELDGHIYLMGNGGSAATANHYANDLAYLEKSPTSKFQKVTSLCSNSAILTMLANDYDYSQIFSRQLECFLRKSDVVMSFSASGNSENILKAVEYANHLGCTTISFTGFDGGILKKISKFNIHVPTTKGEYGVVEDIHLFFDHLMSEYLRQYLKNEQTQNKGTMVYESRN